MAGLALHTHRWGGGERRALLVHGLASNGLSWWRFAPLLAAEGFVVVAPDLRGHGRSPRADRYTFADHAADLARLGTDWDVAVGHSLGGAIVATAVDLGLLRSALVLVDPFLDVADDEYEPLLSDLLAELDVADEAALLAANPSWHPTDAVHKMEAVRQVDRAAVAQCIRDNAPYHHLDLLARLETRVQTIGADPARGALFTEEMAAAAGAPFRMMAGAGHSVHRDDPHGVLAVVTETARAPTE